MKKINRCLVLGANGQIATALQQLVRQFNDEQFLFLTKSRADLTDHHSLQVAIESHQPHVIINCAGYTNVDGAERESELAHAINHQGVETLAKLCDLHAICLVHLSTDYVFSGDSHSPYVETDAVAPLNVYGMSKLLGENAIRAVLPNHIILRVSSIYSEFGNNFLKTMLKLFQEKTTISVVDDQLSCPTSAHSVARVLYRIAKQPEHVGTFHFSGREALSWHQFACFIHDHYQATSSFKIQSIFPTAAKEYGALAVRPSFSVLNCNKILNQYGIAAPCLYADFLELKKGIEAISKEII